MTNALKTTFLLALLTGLLVVIGYFLGGNGGMLLFFGIAVVMNLGAYWYSGDIALRMAGAREVSEEQAPELHQLIGEVAAYAHLPRPRVAIVDSPSPNAFATGRDANHAVVAVTTGILGLLTREELQGVLAHELGHVRNHDILISSVAATIAGAITMLAHVAQWAMLFGGFGGRDDEDYNPFAAILLIILAPLAAMLIQLAISRSREYGADATGARIIGNPEALASALEKLEQASSVRPLPVNPAVAHLFIVNPLKSVNFNGLFSTHPPLEERIRRLRSMSLASVH
ncbi:MAG: zinc metalloprotease HtpX [Chloroflexi bacterium]|nr:zinc metalloprotease HtpX [Chloroflexota bacterium]MBV9134001.1 zinc metalloprotease HtpX [Chloroflexota bacterium]MBV9899349.1 zinc metalloprotease HtpX [Chloroflexota bacterium]